MLSIENPPPDLSCPCEISQLNCSCSNTDDQQPSDVLHSDLLKSCPKFTIRDYAFSNRSKDIKTNWPFSEKSLKHCLNHGIKDLLPPFQSLDAEKTLAAQRCTIATSLVTKEYEYHLIDQASKPTNRLLSFTSDGARPSLTSVHSSPRKSEGVRIISSMVVEAETSLNYSASKPVKKLALVANKAENIMKPLTKKCREMVKLNNTAADQNKLDNNTPNSFFETMASKVCPVCKTFTSSSNTTLNAHIDQCLSGESISQWTSDPKVTKSRIKPRRMRSMVEIYETAKNCTIEELERRNGINLASCSSLPVQDMMVGSVERKRKSPVDFEETENERAVYVDGNGTKLRILSKLNDLSSLVMAEDDTGTRRHVDGYKSSKLGLSKKKKKKLQEKRHKLQLRVSDNKKLCSPIHHRNSQVKRPLTRNASSVGENFFPDGHKLSKSGGLSSLTKMKAPKLSNPLASACESTFGSKRKRLNLKRPRAVCGSESDGEEIVRQAIEKTSDNVTLDRRTYKVRIDRGKIKVSGMGEVLVNKGKRKSTSKHWQPKVDGTNNSYFDNITVGSHDKNVSAQNNAQTCEKDVVNEETCRNLFFEASKGPRKCSDVQCHEVAGYVDVQSDSIGYTKFYDRPSTEMETASYPVVSILNEGEKLFYVDEDGKSILGQNDHATTELNYNDGSRSYYAEEVNLIPIPGPPGSFLPSPSSDEFHGNSTPTSSQDQSSENHLEFADRDSSDSPSPTSTISNSDIAKFDSSLNEKLPFRHRGKVQMSSNIFDATDGTMVDTISLDPSATLAAGEDPDPVEPKVNFLYSETATPSTLKNAQPCCCSCKDDSVFSSAVLNYQDTPLSSWPPMPLVPESPYITLKDSDNTRRANNFNLMLNVPCNGNVPAGIHNVTGDPLGLIPNKESTNSGIKFFNTDGESASPSTSNHILRLMGKNLMVVNNDETSYPHQSAKEILVIDDSSKSSVNLSTDPMHGMGLMNHRRASINPASVTKCASPAVSNCINKDFPSVLEKSIKKELPAVGQAVARTVIPTIERTISTAITEAFQKGVSDKEANQLKKSVNSKLEATVAKQIQMQFQTSGKHALQESLKSSLEASVIPAFEMSCRTMFEQVDDAYQKGMAEHISVSQQRFESSHSSLAITLRDTINSASSLTQTLSTDLVESHRKLLAALAVAGRTPNTGHSLVRELNNGPLAGLHEQIDASVDPTKELSRMIAERKFEEAFTAALQRSDVQIVSWLCSQVDLLGILALDPLPLRQGVLLSLLQQLAYDIGTDTSRKLSWMRDVLSAINPTDPMIVVHIRPVFEQVYQILIHHRSLPTTSAAEISSVRLLMHVVNSILMSCK